MGWWQTDGGGIIGDGPADIIDEANGAWADPTHMPPCIRAEIAECYRKDWSCEPTEQGLCELQQFRQSTAGSGLGSNERSL